MRDVNSGWAVRYTHANVASFFFIIVYAHICLIHENLLNYQHLYNRISSFSLVDFITPKIMIDFIEILKSTRYSQITYNNTTHTNKVSKDFIEWFTGFTDAEGAFMIYTKNHKEVHFVFQI